MFVFMACKACGMVMRVSTLDIGISSVEGETCPHIPATWVGECAALRPATDAEVEAYKKSHAEALEYEASRAEIRARMVALLPAFLAALPDETRAWLEWRDKRHGPTHAKIIERVAKDIGGMFYREMLEVVWEYRSKI